MPVYIIRPKKALFSESLNLAAVKLSPESRQQQIEDLHNLQQENENHQEITRLTEDIRGKEGVNILKSSQQSGITGTTILEMSEEEAKSVSQDLAEKADILRDRPIELIHPANKDSSSFISEGKLQTKDLWHLEAINNLAAGNNGFSETGKNVTVAVLDTGIDSTHPALQGKVSAAHTFNSEKWLVEPQTPSLDTEGHGTHVAGLICGKTIGVAPDAKLINGVLIPGGRGMLSNFVLAIEWIASQPEIQIVNISAGIPGYISDWEEIIDDLVAIGVLPICAVGNEGRDQTRSPGNYRSVVSVGASNKRNRVASFSGGGTLTVNNHTYTAPDLVAPGQQVYSAIVQGGYEAWDGTSMATPIVSGIASLLLERNPQIHVLELKDELLSMCENLGQPRDRQGEGLIKVIRNK
ncbi:MAG: S8 family serine peptidase [Cyanobacteria bacterium P01_F01_bin.143]